MTASGPVSPGAASPSGRPDPLSMSVAEKLACEWEARHDVIARGGRLGNPAALAHYCTHARCQENVHGHHDHGHHDHGHHRHHGEAHGWSSEDHLRSWVRWGEDGAR